MKDKYCLPIIKTNATEVLEMIDQHKDDYGYFEVWLDYIEDLNLDFISDLVNKYPDRIIFVLRRQNLDPVKMPQQQRMKVLDLITDKNCLIDLDITIQAEELNYLKNSGKDKNLLISYHNYELTPADNELQKIIDEMESYSPGIIKLSTMCNSKDDALRLLTLEQQLLKAGRKHIVLGMGKDGQITRVFATLWGNALAFVPETSDDESAKGQITREKLDRIMKELED